MNADLFYFRLIKMGRVGLASVAQLSQLLPPSQSTQIGVATQCKDCRQAVAHRANKEEYRRPRTPSPKTLQAC